MLDCIVEYIKIISFSVIILIIFATIFDSKKYRDCKGTLKQKFFASLVVVCIFLLPYYDQDKIFWFDVCRSTIFLGILWELLMNKSCNKYRMYTFLLIILSFLAFIYTPDNDIKNIYATVTTLFIAVCMDTGMSIYGKFLVSRIPNRLLRLPYPESISKNKSFLAVILSTLTVVTIFYLLFDVSFTHILIICISTFVGDAVFSHYKRKNDIDDFSNLLGPIGGFCDRFDGWVFVLIVHAILY